MDFVQDRWRRWAIAFGVAASLLCLLVAAWIVIDGEAGVPGSGRGTGGWTAVKGWPALAMAACWAWLSASAAFYAAARASPARHFRMLWWRDLALALAAGCFAAAAAGLAFGPAAYRA